MSRDILGLGLALAGVPVFGVGAFVFLDLYWAAFPVLPRLPRQQLLGANLVFGGYGLLEVGRYVATEGGTRESPYFSDRTDVVSGGRPSSGTVGTTTVTGRWFPVLGLGLLGQILWALQEFVVSGAISSPLLRLWSLATVVVAAHFDMEYVAARADWGGHRRWEIGFVVFPLNLALAVAYVWLRRRHLAATDGRGGEFETITPPETATPDGHDGEAPGEDPSDSRWEWYYLVGGALVGWLVTIAVLEFDGVSGGLVESILTGDVTGGALVGSMAVTVWVLLPVATYFDTERVTSDLWTPRRAYWVLGSAIPVLNVVGGGAYLLRRYETVRATDTSPPDSSSVWR